VLTLYTGPDHKVLRQRILKDILQQVNNGRDHQVLLVPEQFSFEAERQLCRLGGDTVCRFAEVLSLTRLASRVESIYGGTGNVWLDGGGRLLAAAQAVEQVSSRLKLYAGVCRKTEFLEMLLSAVDEFGSYGIAPETLMRLSDRYSGQFAQKLAELGLLYESYLAVCTRAQDPVVRLQNLRDVLAREDFAEERDFYIFGFTDFTRLESEIVEQLILAGRSVTLALPEESAGGLPVFPTAARTAQMLRKFCAKNNIPVRAETFGFDESVPEDLLHLHRSVSLHGETPFGRAAEHVSLRRLASREAECRSLASSVAELVQGGTSFREITVVCTDLRAYRPVLRTVLERAQIPYFLSGKDPITDNVGARILLSAVRAAAEGLEQEAVLEYLKSGAVTLPEDACDRLENYAHKWNIRGGLWTAEWTQHPKGLDAQWHESDCRELQRLNFWRETGLGKLFSLRDALQASTSMGSMAKAAFTFIEQIGLDRRLQTLADDLYDKKEFARAQQFGQVYEILLDSLEQICLMIPDAPATPEGFCRLLEKLLLQYHVGAIPAAVDQLTVGDLAAALTGNVRHLFILGAQERCFPVIAHSVGVFTEDERRVLMEEGLSMAPLRADAMDREIGSICSALRSARGSVSISCAGDEPSFLLRKLGAIFGGLQEPELNPVLLDRAERSAALLRRGALREPDMDAYQRELWEKSHYRFGTVTPEQVRDLYGESVFLSASRIDKFADCRFAFFMKYGLKLQTDDPVRFNAAAFGTFVHAVLEETAALVMERGGFAAVSREELERLADGVMDAYAQEALRDLTDSGERFRFLFRRNREEALAVVRELGDEMLVSDFTPAAFELAFGKDRDMEPIIVKTEKAQSHIEGFVDRVDLCRIGEKTYVRVVDYKTGSKDFDYADLTVGSGLQMLIYLFALRQNGKLLFGDELTPAGVLYQPAKEVMGSYKARPTEKEIQKTQMGNHRRKGLVLDDDDVLEAMERCDGETRFLPYTLKKGGRTGDLANSTELEQLEQYVFSKLQQITDEICCGDVTPNPVMRGSENSACRYCDFSDVCQKDLAEHRPRRLRAIKNREFFKEVCEGRGDQYGQNDADA